MPVIEAATFTTMLSGITANVPVLVTAGVAIMGIIIGASMIPKIIYKFF